MKAIGFAFIYILTAISIDALAFPEMVRHSYTNCITCHVSPSGGGVLTPYGRSISKELLSTWGAEGEERPFWSVESPYWLQVGGDQRAMQFQRETPTNKEAHFFWMENEIEPAVTISLGGKMRSIESSDEGTATPGEVSPQTLSIVGTLGVKSGSPSKVNGDQFLSMRHYFLYRPFEEVSVRAGRFRAAYGLGMPDHTAFVKRGLGLDQGTETYNLESAWFGAKTNFYLTGIFGRPDDTLVIAQRGAALTTEYALGISKIGWSFLTGNRGGNSNFTTGPHGVVAFSPKVFLLSEADGFQIAGAAKTPKGIATYNRLDYEWVQGLHFYGTHEVLQNDLEDGSTRSDRYGIGTQVFPRPHFEFRLDWQKSRTLSAGDYWTDLVSLLMHYYI